MHANNLGVKRPEELSVCYLSGPEPENDFAEFVSMGIKPQNMWAFECERNTYLQRLTKKILTLRIILTSYRASKKSPPRLLYSVAVIFFIV